MIAKRSARSLLREIRIHAFAKINLTLRILGVRADGYHELRTTFQTVALHDTLTFTAAPGPLQIVCDDPACPVDRTNLVWRAAEQVWRAAGRRGSPRDLRVAIRKRIPLQSGLGGGSSDAAAALRALTAFWPVDVSDGDLRTLAAGLGSDVPFLLSGGTALGLGRGELLFPLTSVPSLWVVLALPDFGVGTKEAYRWFDDQPVGTLRPPRTSAALLLDLPESELINDLTQPVSRRHPAIERLIRRLERERALYAGMSGSGSTVFGLFGTRADADAAAAALARTTCRTLVTRTLDRRQHERLGAPRVGQGRSFSRNGAIRSSRVGT